MVCLSLTLVSPAKTAEMIELPFGLRTADVSYQPQHTVHPVCTVVTRLGHLTRDWEQQRRCVPWQFPDCREPSRTCRQDGSTMPAYSVAASQSWQSHHRSWNYKLESQIHCLSSHARKPTQQLHYFTQIWRNTPLTKSDLATSIINKCQQTKPGVEWGQALVDISCLALYCHSNETRAPRLQIHPTVHN